MKKHKRVSRSEALGKIATAPVTRLEAEPFRNETGLAKFTREEAEREAAEKVAQLAPMQELATEHSKALRELIDQDMLAGLDTPSSFLEATTQGIGDGSQFNNIPPDAIRATIRRALSEAEDKITDGKLTESGRQKCWTIARANRNCDVTQSASWYQIFYLLRAAGELGVTDFIPAAPEQEQPEDLLAELESQPDTEAGRKRAQQISLLHHYSVEVREVMMRFLEHCDTQFGFTPTESQLRAMVQWFTDANRSMLNDRHAWNDMRVALVKRCILPRVSPDGRSLLTPDELVSERVEVSSFVGDGAYAAKRELAQELSKLNR